MNIFELFVVVLVSTIGFYFVESLLPPSHICNGFPRFGFVFALTGGYIGIVMVCAMFFHRIQRWYRHDPPLSNGCPQSESDGAECTCPNDLNSVENAGVEGENAKH